MLVLSVAAYFVLDILSYHIAHLIHKLSEFSNLAKKVLFDTLEKEGNKLFGGYRATPDLVNTVHRVRKMDFGRTFPDNVYCLPRGLIIS
jgi:hypothetical protein